MGSSAGQATDSVFDVRRHGVSTVLAIARTQVRSVSSDVQLALTSLAHDCASEHNEDAGRVLMLLNLSRVHISLELDNKIMYPEMGPTRCSLSDRGRPMPHPDPANIGPDRRRPWLAP